jgi:hypothetical protein
MGRLVGPLSPTNGFHGAGPFRRGVDIRRVTAVSASAISSRARFAPRQKCTPATLHDLTRRAQQARLINADIVAEDLPRIIAMLHSVLPTMDTASDGWRRYVTFILNAMSTAEPSKLPPASPIIYTPQPDTWPR